MSLYRVLKEKYGGKIGVYGILNVVGTKTRSSLRDPWSVLRDSNMRSVERFIEETGGKGLIGIPNSRRKK